MNVSYEESPRLMASMSEESHLVLEANLRARNNGEQHRLGSTASLEGL